jgi:hypothetical protein
VFPERPDRQRHGLVQGLGSDADRVPNALVVGERDDARADGHERGYQIRPVFAMTAQAEKPQIRYVILNMFLPIVACIWWVFRIFFRNHDCRQITTATGRDGGGRLPRFPGWSLVSLAQPTRSLKITCGLRNEPGRGGSNEETNVRYT